MILAIDIGNTTVGLCGLEGGSVCFEAHLDTTPQRSAAEYRLGMRGAFSACGLGDSPRFEGAVLTSVVPSLTPVLCSCAAEFSQNPPLVAHAGLASGLRLGISQTGTLGMDRLADAAAAAEYYPLPVITVGLIGGDGIGPIIMDQAKRVLSVLLEDEISGGRVVLKEIEGLTIENRLALGKAVPEDVLEAIVQHIPAPTGDDTAPLQALIFDAFYDNYRGAICFVRIKQGAIRAGMRMRLMAGGGEFDVVEVGTFAPGYRPCNELRAGDVGYVAASIKDVRDTRVGDTITDAARPAASPLPGYRHVTPMVYCGIYPADGADYPALKDALEKLRMNDASLSFDPETSVALGYGFRCGFLGLLHMDIITTRLEREWDLNLVTTAPSVIYQVTKTDGNVLMIDNPSNLPRPDEIRLMEEPFVHATIYTPQDSVGTLMDLCKDKRGIFIDMQYEGNRVKLNYDMPLNEIIFDFFDQIKSRSRGYASFDYELKDYRESDLVKLDILLNGDLCDAFSIIVHRDKAYARGRGICEKLKDVIPRQMFEIPIQAAIGGKVIARETVKAMRKDVLAKCYGGDITRKKKLLEKQKEGKKRMRQFGTVQVPSEAFLAVLKMD